MPDQDLGVLKYKKVQDIWPNEASDFTPWLEQNVALLGEALGMELEITDREASIGDFRVDLLGRDLSRNRAVIIENQLERTNHDHLGKLLTYAAGRDAGVVIWITTEFRDEHRQALDWLNQHTDDVLEFYGVVLEAIQVDASRPAAHFRVVASPNAWRKSSRGAGAEPSERGEAYRGFFQGLIDKLRETGLSTARAAQPTNWMAFASGYGGIRYVFSFAKGGRVRTELYIDRGDADLNADLFDRLHASKETIEHELAAPLSWERLDDKRACRAAIYREGSIDADPETLEGITQWGIDHLHKFKDVFGPLLKQIV